MYILAHQPFTNILSNVALIRTLTALKLSSGWLGIYSDATWPGKLYITIQCISNKDSISQPLPMHSFTMFHRCISLPPFSVFSIQSCICTWVANSSIGHVIGLSRYLVHVAVYVYSIIIYISLSSAQCILRLNAAPAHPADIPADIRSRSRAEPEP